MDTLQAAQSSVMVMVDFDNFYRQDLDEGDFSWLSHDINRLIESALSTCREATEIRIRLYGGWNEEAVSTPLSAKLQQALTSAPTFPMSHPYARGLLRGEVTLATSLLSAPTIEWLHTRRTKSGLPRIRLAKDHLDRECGKPNDTCPARILNRFTKNKHTACPIADCNNTNKSIFKATEQKMVDTLIACDLVAAALDSNNAGIILCSDDSDLWPPLTMAATKAQGKPIKVFGTEQTRTPHYKPSMSALGISFENWIPSK